MKNSMDWLLVFLWLVVCGRSFHQGDLGAALPSFAAAWAYCRLALDAGAQL